MNIKKTKNIKKKSTDHHFLIFAIIVLTSLSTLFILEKTNITNFSDLFNTEVINKKKQNEVDNTNKQNFIEDKDTVKPTTNQNENNTTKNIKLSTTRQPDGSVNVLSELANYSDGNCNLVVKNGDKQYAATAIVLYQSNFSTCAGFNIPISELGLGVWNISLTVTSNSIVDTQNIEAEIK